MDADVKRRLENLERAQEEDRKMQRKLDSSVSDLVAEMRVSNAYAKENYKRIEKAEAHREKQEEALNNLTKAMIKNQPAVDSVNKIKAGLIGVVFTVIAGVSVNWIIAHNAPPVNKTEKEMILKQLEKLEKLERHEHE